MEKGGAVEGIIPPEPLGVSPPFPMSLFQFALDEFRAGSWQKCLQIDVVKRVAFWDGESWGWYKL
jgi:hypothetical protein